MGNIMSPITACCDTELYINQALGSFDAVGI